MARKVENEKALVILAKNADRSDNLCSHISQKNFTGFAYFLVNFVYMNNFFSN